MILNKSHWNWNASVSDDFLAVYRSDIKTSYHASIIYARSICQALLACEAVNAFFYVLLLKHITKMILTVPTLSLVSQVS